MLLLLGNRLWRLFKKSSILPLGNKMRMKTKTQFLSSLLVLDEQSGRPKLHLALFSKKDFWDHFHSLILEIILINFLLIIFFLGGLTIKKEFLLSLKHYCYTIFNNTPITSVIM